MAAAGAPGTQSIGLEMRRKPLKNLKDPLEWKVEMGTTVTREQIHSFTFLLYSNPLVA